MGLSKYAETQFFKVHSDLLLTIIRVAITSSATTSMMKRLFLKVSLTVMSLFSLWVSAMISNLRAEIGISFLNGYNV